MVLKTYAYLCLSDSTWLSSTQSSSSMTFLNLENIRVADPILTVLFALMIIAVAALPTYQLSAHMGFLPG